MSKILKIGIPLLIVAGVVFGYSLYNKPRKSVSSEDAAFQMGAAELAAAFMQDESKANDLYLGKVIEVRGEVAQLVEEDATYGLILDGGADGSVYCSFKKSPQVKVGETITLKGTCSGYLMDVVINDCVLKESDS